MEPVDLVCVGLTVLDVLGRPVSQIPEGGSVALIEQIRLTPAGTAAAPAMIAARMGLRTRLVGGIGCDEIGDVIEAGLVRRGVDVSALQRIDALPSSATLLPIPPEGERPALHAPGASLLVDIDDPAPYLDTRFLHLGGVGTMPHMDAGKSRVLLEAARARGVTTTCDLISPGPSTLEALERVMPFVDYFMPTLDEAVALSGAAGAESAAAFFRERGAGVCIFKDGSRGSLLATGSGVRRIPSFEVEVVDTSGCGDAYCGGFIAALAHDLPLEDACRFASATAALVATGLGSDAGVEGYEHTRDAMNRLSSRS